MPKAPEPYPCRRCGTPTTNITFACDTARLPAGPGFTLTAAQRPEPHPTPLPLGGLGVQSGDPLVQFFVLPASLLASCPTPLQGGKSFFGLSEPSRIVNQLASRKGCERSKSHVYPDGRSTKCKRLTLWDLDLKNRVPAPALVTHHCNHLGFCAIRQRSVLKDTNLTLPPLEGVGFSAAPSVAGIPCRGAPRYTDASAEDFG